MTGRVLADGWFRVTALAPSSRKRRERTGGARATRPAHGEGPPLADDRVCVTSPHNTTRSRTPRSEAKPPEVNRLVLLKRALARVTSRDPSIRVRLHPADGVFSVRREKLKVPAGQVHTHQRRVVGSGLRPQVERSAAGCAHLQHVARTKPKHQFVEPLNLAGGLDRPDRLVVSPPP